MISGVILNPEYCFYYYYVSKVVILYQHLNLVLLHVFLKLRICASYLTASTTHIGA